MPVRGQAAQAASLCLEGCRDGILRLPHYARLYFSPMLIKLEKLEI